MNKIIGFLKDNAVVKFLSANWTAVFKPTIVLFAICVVIALALSLADSVTAEKIEKLASEQEKAAMAGLIEADEFVLKTVEGKEYYVAQSGTNAVGYIFIRAAKGYGGAVSVMTAVNADGSVAAIDILDASNETPGLGQNVAKPKFYGQFADKIKGVIVKKGAANGDNNEVAAVTGATISSRAVTEAVNEALSDYATLTSADESEVVTDE